MKRSEANDSVEGGGGNGRGRPESVTDHLWFCGFFLQRYSPPMECIVRGVVFSDGVCVEKDGSLFGLLLQSEAGLLF